MYCFFDVILSMPTPPTKGGFRGGAAVRPHPPEHIFAPPWAYFRTPQNSWASRFINSNSLKKSIIFIITGWFYVVLSFSLYSQANELFLYLVDNMFRSKLVLTKILTSGKKIWFGKRRKFFSIGFVDAPANLKRWLFTSSYHVMCSYPAHQALCG